LEVLLDLEVVLVDLEVVLVDLELQVDSEVVLVV